MRYWTSDLHFGHVNIIEYTGRPFVDTNHMREMLVQYWNETVGADDEVMIVGDFAMGRILETLPVATRLNGYKILIPGNHDRCWEGASGNPEKHREWVKEYSKYFEIRNGPIHVDIDGYEVLVNHFPYIEMDRHGDRYSAWRSEDEGLWLIHGHTHEHVNIKPHSREIHVGLDAWDCRPVPEDWIAEMIRSHS